MEHNTQFNVVSFPAQFPKSLYKNVYIYVDSADKRSYRLIEQKRIRGFRPLRIYNIEQINRTEQFSLICCEVNKSDEQAFMGVLDELYRNLLIMGYRDYERICDQLLEKLAG